MVLHRLLDPGSKLADYANDPNETQIQYDLYRIPFNEGKGGKPEQILGASQNGMSNNFPKVSPDGRWIACTRISQSKEIWRAMPPVGYSGFLNLYAPANPSAA
jgi:hypothetical protein